MAIYTPMQVPQPSPPTKRVRLAPNTPKRVHTRRAHRTGFALDITLALIAVVVLLLILF
jgi:D-alanyl-D-alanine dipeptidase